MKFVGWLVDTSGNVIGEVYQAIGIPGCLVALFVSLVVCIPIYGACGVLSMMPLAWVFEHVDPYGLLVNPAGQELVQQIEAGSSPVELSVVSKLCNQGDDCGHDNLYRPEWFVDPGQKYLEITVKNNAPQKSQSLAVGSTMYFPNEPDTNLICSIDLTTPPTNEWDSGYKSTAYCKTQGQLPTKVCMKFTFPDLYLDKLPPEHPTTTVCKNAN